MRLEGDSIAEVDLLTRGGAAPATIMCIEKRSRFMRVEGGDCEIGLATASDCYIKSYLLKISPSGERLTKLLT